MAEPPRRIQQRERSRVCVGVTLSSLLNPKPCVWRERPLEARKRAIR